MNDEKITNVTYYTVLYCKETYYRKCVNASNGKVNEHNFIHDRIHGARVSEKVKSHARDFPVLKLS